MEKTETGCKVCGDKASGKHYGVPSCDGCRGFFKRSIRRGLAYHCKESGSCVVDVTRRNQCQACRFKKCLAVNMKRDAVQHERAPRTPAPTSSCTTRRHFPFSPTSGLVPHSTPMTDMPGYHLIYPQPTLPFPLGLKPPMSLPLGLFNYSSFTPSLLSHDASSLLRLPSNRFTISMHTKTVSDQPKVKHETTSADDEVTSSEEANLPSEANKAGQELSLSPSLLELPLPHGPESVYECAAKLLFITVKWARSIPSFLQLPFQDQTILLEESWSGLFVLGAGEWVLPIDKDFLLSQTLNSCYKRADLEKEVLRLQQIIARFTTLRLDHTEYSCLKALTLFKPEKQELEHKSQVESFQEQAHSMLQDHCGKPEIQKSRFGKLLLLLPTVHTMSKQLLEELLFRKTIGNISIERVLFDMLRSNAGG